MTTLTRDEFNTTLENRFGENPARWAFKCPACGDIATGQDFRQALKDHPRKNRHTGGEMIASDIMGQECIGRTLGALEGPAKDWNGRGCDWCAYGLFAGPDFIEVPNEYGTTTKVPCFPIATVEEAENAQHNEA